MWDGVPTPPRPLSGSGRRGVGVLCIIGVRGGLSRISILLDVWGTFDFAALWAPFVERTGFRAILAVWGVLDSLDMGTLCVALGCVVRGYRVRGCFGGIVEFHYFTSTSMIFTRYIIVCGTELRDPGFGYFAGAVACSRSSDGALWGCVWCVCSWRVRGSFRWLGVVGISAIFRGLLVGSVVESECFSRVHMGSWSLMYFLPDGVGFACVALAILGWVIGGGGGGAPPPSCTLQKCVN